MKNNHMKELTMEERAKVFMSYGLLKEVATPNGNLKVTSYHIDSLVTMGGKPWSYRECQLILTPLGEITDEDAIEVARIILDKEVGWNPLEILRWDWCTRMIIRREPDITDAETTVEMCISILTELDESPIRWTWNYIKGNGTGISERNCPNVITAIDFLRSRSYALPYKGINLYQAGIAVKPEKK